MDSRSARQADQAMTVAIGNFCNLIRSKADSIAFDPMGMLMDMM
jgi:hypothetical protein